MTNAELVALLREAREDLALAHADLDALRQTRKMSTLTARIDAALAAHDAVPPSEERVEWKPFQGGYYADIGPVQLQVTHVTRGWIVDVNRQEGIKTEAEAKSAAIAAAKGMR